MQRRAPKSCAVAVFLMVVAQADAKEPTYIERMDAAAAICAIDAMSGEADVSKISKKYGNSSKQWTIAYQKYLDQSRQCAEKAKIDGKPLYKAEVERLPRLRATLSAAYVAWLQYLDNLSQIGPIADAYRTNYETATYQLQAELDAM